jgi:purine-nucleoside/S-methyl-5'-thioadenosine phosphorylase / adenosine deaminase
MMDVLGSILTLADGRLLWRETATVTYLEPLALSAHPRLRCAFTTRHAGRSGQSLNLSFDKGERPAVLAHRQHVLQALGLEQTTLCTVRQVHGNQVCIVDAAMLQRGLTGITADALVTNLAQVTLGVLVADCLPIVLYTLDTPMIALVHAGRMGTYHRVVQHSLEMIEHHFATPPAQVHAVLGPAIGACCYTLDLRAVGPFQDQFPIWEQFFVPHGPERWTMDLLTANTLQLQAAGVPAEQIDTASICTACHKHDLYSHRAEGQEAGRGMAIVALTSPARASQ